MPGGEKLTKQQRTALWLSHHGESFRAKCWIQWCDNTFRVTDAHWHAAHVIPRSEGGPLVFANLRIICAGCNGSMGTSTATEYNRRHPAMGNNATQTAQLVHFKPADVQRIVVEHFRTLCEPLRQERVLDDGDIEAVCWIHKCVILPFFAGVQRTA